MTATNKFSFPAGDQVHVWVANLDVAQSVVTACAEVLDASEAARAARFHFERDRRRFTLARGFLRKLIGKYLACDPAAVQFAIGAHGKPHLAADGSGLSFNLSHSGTRALFAFASGRRAVGIDLEAGERLGEDWPGLARRTFSGREQAELAAIPPERRRDAFLNGWTRKEAYLKATGQGLVNGLQQIEVTLDNAPPAAFLTAALAGQWQLRDLRPLAGVAAAMVVAGHGAVIEKFTAPADFRL